jgi:hypothetical protein
VGLAAAVAVVWLVAAKQGSDTSGAASAGPIAGMRTYSNLSRNHVKGPVNYPQVPPVGGPHSAVWQNCGIYPTPVGNEHAVHSLEHGAMWITYQPSLRADEVAAIRSAVAGQKYALVSPYPGLPSPVVATVWGKQVRLDSASDPRLKNFITLYASGAQAPEPGESCSGALGAPMAPKP